MAGPGDDMLRIVLVEQLHCDHIKMVELCLCVNCIGSELAVGRGFVRPTLAACCNNKSNRPHRCGSLANNVEYIDRDQVRACPSMTPKNATSRGGSEALRNTWFLEPT